MQAEHKNPSKSPWLFVLSPKIILSPKTLDYAFQRWMIHNIFMMVKPSNPVNRLSLKYIFRQSDFQINWFGNSLFSSPQISRKIKLWDKVYQCKFTKAYKGKREEKEWERIWDWKKNKQNCLSVRWMATICWSNKAAISTLSWYQGAQVMLKLTPLLCHEWETACLDVAVEPKVREKRDIVQAQRNRHVGLVLKRNLSKSLHLALSGQGEMLRCRKPTMWHFTLPKPGPMCEIWPVADRALSEIVGTVSVGSHSGPACCLHS